MARIMRMARTIGVYMFDDTLATVDMHMIGLTLSKVVVKEWPNQW